MLASVVGWNAIIENTNVAIMVAIIIEFVFLILLFLTIDYETRILTVRLILLRLMLSFLGASCSRFFSLQFRLVSRRSLSFVFSFDGMD